MNGRLRNKQPPLASPYALSKYHARNQPGTVVLESLDDLPEVGLDGAVIATPSVLHAEQAIAALERGVPVFCQKARTRPAAACAAGGARECALICREGFSKPKLAR